MAALFARERAASGRRSRCRCSRPWSSFAMVEHLCGSLFEPPLGPPEYPPRAAAARGRTRPATATSAVMIYNDKHWRAFFDAIGNPAWSSDPMFASMRDAHQNIGAVLGALRRDAGEASTAEWLALFRECACPGDGDRQPGGSAATTSISSSRLLGGARRGRATCVSRHPDELFRARRRDRRCPGRRSARTAARCSSRRGSEGRIDGLRRSRRGAGRLMRCRRSMARGLLEGRTARDPARDRTAARTFAAADGAAAPAKSMSATRRRRRGGRHYSVTDGGHRQPAASTYSSRIDRAGPAVRREKRARRWPARCGSGARRRVRAHDAAAGPIAGLMGTEMERALNRYAADGDRRLATFGVGEAPGYSSLELAAKAGLRRWPTPGLSLADVDGLFAASTTCPRPVARRVSRHQPALHRQRPHGRVVVHEPPQPRRWRSRRGGATSR